MEETNLEIEGIQEYEDKMRELNEQKEIIKAEIQEVQGKIDKIKQEASAQFNRFLAENKNIIYQLIDHERTSCSDDNRANGIGSALYDNGVNYRCAKCALMDILEMETLFEDYDINFSVDIRPVKR